MVIRHLFRLLEFLLRQKRFNLSEILARIRVVVIMRLAGPEARIVQRDSFGLCPAENHSGGKSVAQRRGLHPALGRLLVPDQHVARASRGAGPQPDTQSGGGNGGKESSSGYECVPVHGLFMSERWQYCRDRPGFVPSRGRFLARMKFSSQAMLIAE